MDNYDLMWSRLDAEYGSPSKIVDFVLSNIKKLKPIPDGNNVMFLELINTVESGWHDLKRLDKQAEIENITVITLIEKLLPSNIMREWVLRRNKVLDDTLLFNELMLFLLDERKIIKYVEDDIRKPNPVPKAKACNLTYENSCEPNASNVDCLDMFKQFQGS